jgi:hypothetical protein
MVKNKKLNKFEKLISKYETIEDIIKANRNTAS